MVGSIRLTPQEQELVRQIEEHYTAAQWKRDPKRAEAAGFAQLDLVLSLANRNALLTRRTRYFSNAQCNPSNPSVSKEELFRQNVGSDTEMFVDSDFWKYLHHFIFGAKLPTRIQQQFFDKSKDSFNEWDALVRLARQQARSLTMDRACRADEFYKLALDCDWEVHEALDIRRSILTVRS